MPLRWLDFRFRRVPLSARGVRGAWASLDSFGAGIVAGPRGQSVARLDASPLSACAAATDLGPTMPGRLTKQFTRYGGGAAVVLAVVVGVSLGLLAESAAKGKVSAANAVAANEVAAALPVESWAGVWHALPNRGDVAAWNAHGDVIAGTQRQIAMVAGRNERTRIRALHPAAGADGSPGKGDGNWEVGLSSASVPHWRAALPESAELAVAWREGRADAPADQGGERILRSFRRIDDSHGRPVLILETAAPLGAALFQARMGALAVFGVLVSLLAGVFFMARRAIVGVDADVALLREQVQNLAAEGIHTAWETGVLALSPRLPREIEAARSELSRRLRYLDEQLADAETALASAEMVLEPDALVRRLALAELNLDPNVTLEAPGGRCDTVELVDLGFDHIVVRASRYTMVDIAPGMPVAVGWSGSDSAQTLMLERRIERESELEYVFRVQPSRMLPGTPPAISRLAYARKATRMSCEGTEVRAVVLAGTQGPLEGTVLDLSTAGIGVRVRCEIADLTATGTSATIVLRLAEGGPEYQVGVIIRSVRARPGGCDLGCAIDPTMTVDAGTLRVVLGAWVEQRRRAVVVGSVSKQAAA